MTWRITAFVIASVVIALLACWLYPQIPPRIVFQSCTGRICNPTRSQYVATPRPELPEPPGPPRGWHIRRDIRPEACDFGSGEGCGGGSWEEAKNDPRRSPAP